MVSDTKVMVSSGACSLVSVMEMIMAQEAVSPLPSMSLASTVSVYSEVV